MRYLLATAVILFLIALIFTLNMLVPALVQWTQMVLP